MPGRTCAVYLPNEMVDRLKRHAKGNGISLSEQVRRRIADSETSELERRAKAVSDREVSILYSERLPNGDERTLIATTGCLPVVAISDQTPVADVPSGGQQVFFSAIDGADRSGSTQALRDANSELPFADERFTDGT